VGYVDKKAYPFAHYGGNIPLYEKDLPPRFDENYEEE